MVSLRYVLPLKVIGLKIQAKGNSMKPQACHRCAPNRIISILDLLEENDTPIKKKGENQSRDPAQDIKIMG